MSHEVTYNASFIIKMVHLFKTRVKDKNITIKEGTGSGAQSFCGAVDKDGRAYSADINKYTVNNVKVRNQ